MSAKKFRTPTQILPVPILETLSLKSFEQNSIMFFSSYLAHEILALQNPTEGGGGNLSPAEHSGGRNSTRWIEKNGYRSRSGQMKVLNF